MILKTARRGALMTVAGAAVLTLTACGAGQISQTADQVAAVDGSGADTANKEVAVRDVTIIVNEDQTVALKFTAVNQDDAHKPHKLNSVKVAGKEVTLSEKPEIARNCSVVADSAMNIEALKKSDNVCISYITTTLQNDGFAAGGRKPVTFSFDSGEIKLDATIAANHNEVNTGNRVDPAHAGH
ncbi:hypothetical protein [Corynebacterium epidermidicanis]|uniref:Lipoprotein LpqE n=1 Tax=Corynebacterium epidermidicanis TaxID=1050174 RepID=A0A0G3GTT9_9CORY|nr:hypothetical protein [Corynebacterium epidermidicanis]AKK03965.1 hypothetical protein CEPID_10680 [Corynebacterium epidermidicanis]